MDWFGRAARKIHWPLRPEESLQKIPVLPVFRVAEFRQKLHFSDMASSPPPSAYTDLARDISRLRSRLRKHTCQVHIPQSAGLLRRRPNSHFHPTPELLAQLGGASIFECPEDRFQVDCGDCCLIPRGVPHAETPLDTSTPYSLLVFMQAPRGLCLHRGRASPARHILGHGSILLESPLALEAFRLLETLCLQRPQEEKLSQEYSAEILCAFLTAALAALHQSANQQNPPPPDAPSPLVAAATSLVQTHLGDSSLSVHGIATSLGCSPDHLSRRFRKEIGHSLQTFILEERIALACDLLHDARFNIAEVGWACGFNEPAHFIRTFGRLRGTTPLRFRNSHKS